MGPWFGLNGQQVARDQVFEQSSLLSSPYLAGVFRKLPAIIECGLVGQGFTACPVSPGERAMLSPLRDGLLDVEREQMQGLASGSSR